MAQQDKIKWDQKYQENIKLRERRAVSKKLEAFADLKATGKALDVACGTGRNSIYLAKSGFLVDAVDISSVALEDLKSKNIPNIKTHLIDLDLYTPPKQEYDLILMCNFLDRGLIPKLCEALVPNGILIVETYMHHPINTKPNSNPDFLLQKEELLNYVPKGFVLIDYDEFDNEADELYRMRKQSLVIKKVF
jgi:SAM-dependent methyltransferase